jgi:hypothetical protein
VSIIILAAGFCGVDQGCPIQPGLIGIKGEDAGIAERDFHGLPGGFFAMMRVLPEEAWFIVCGWGSIV